MTETIQKITIVVIIISIILLLSYDTIAALLGGSNATISWITWTYAHKFPLIPFAVGFLCGHLFWTQVSGLIKP